MGGPFGSGNVGGMVAIAALLALGCGAGQVQGEAGSADGAEAVETERKALTSAQGPSAGAPVARAHPAGPDGGDAALKLPATPVGRLPPEPGATPPLDAASRAALGDFVASLGNAAVRDHELESLIRAYLGISRGIFANFRSAQGGAGKQGVYDPEALPEVHRRLAKDLNELSARAVLLAEALRAIAAAGGIDLERPGTLGGRGERLQLFTTLLGCIRHDTQRRIAHGESVGLLLSSGRVDAFTDAESAELLRREVAMLRETMRCTSLATRRSPPDGDRG